MRWVVPCCRLSVCSGLTSHSLGRDHTPRDFLQLVVISGLVWHRIPHKWVSGSCAWAARVYVDSR